LARLEACASYDASLALGYEHSATLIEGRLLTTGSNEHGCLAHGDHEPRVKFELCKELSGIAVTAIAAGNFHLLLLDAGGGIYTAGYGAKGRLGHGDQEDLAEAMPLAGFGVRTSQNPVAIRIAAGGAHSLVLCEGGGLYSFGCGASGRLGLGGLTDRYSPSQVDPICNGDGDPISIVGIAAGGAHSMAWGTDGELFTWGGGTATGHGGNCDVLTPRLVEALRGTVVVEACGGGSHSLARAAEGLAYSCLIIGHMSIYGNKH